MIRRNAEQLVDLIQHFPVLPGEGNHALKEVRLHQRPHNGSHLDGFRASPKNRHDGVHDFPQMTGPGGRSKLVQS